MAGEITILLRRWRGGDEFARQELIPHVYPHLRKVAAGYLRRESSEHTLQPTALVHELYIRVLQQQPPAHVLGLALKWRNLTLITEKFYRVLRSRQPGTTPQTRR